MWQVYTLTHIKNIIIQSNNKCYKEISEKYYIKAIMEIWNFSRFKTFQFSSVRLVQSAVRGQLAAAHLKGYFPEHWKQIHREKFCSQITHRRKLYNQTIISTRNTERILLPYLIYYLQELRREYSYHTNWNTEGILLPYLTLHLQEIRREYSYHTH